jgi:ABC-type polysaccharide/polyol phosphate export permease
MPQNLLIKGPLSNPTLWITLGWLDVVQSYRRSFLGPFWITISMAIYVISTTLLYGAIFGVPPGQYAAYAITGMIGWTWIQALITDMGNTFITYSNYVKSMPIDKAQLVWAVAFKQTIVLAHNMIVYVVAAVLGVIPITFYSLWFIPAAALFFLMSIPFTGCLAILFARYRDLPRLVSSVIIIIMLLTPVFWMPNLVTGWRTIIFKLNPFYYCIALLRQPLLGEKPDLSVIFIFLGMTIVVWVVGSLFYRRYNRFVPFWV